MNAGDSPASLDFESGPTFAPPRERLPHLSRFSKGGTPQLPSRTPGRVPLDKSEGGVKDKSILSVFLAPLFCQRGLRTKTLEISR